MRAEGTFHVASFVPAEIQPSPAGIEVGIPVGTAVMEKQYAGGVSGRSATVFTSAFDMAAGVGTYVAMETFEGPPRRPDRRLRLRPLGHDDRF